MIIGTVTVILLTAFAVYFLAKGGAGLLKGAAEAFRKERELLSIQEAQVTTALSEIMVKQALAEKRMKNNLVVAQLIADRAADPKWMGDFDRGRDNAPWN